MSRCYEVKARGSHYPVWMVRAPSRKSALDKAAAVTRMPRHTLWAEYVTGTNDPRPRFPEDDE